MTRYNVILKSGKIVKEDAISIEHLGSMLQMFKKVNLRDIKEIYTLSEVKLAEDRAKKLKKAYKIR